MTNTSPSRPSPIPKPSRLLDPLVLHRGAVVLLYVIGAVTAIKVLSLPEAQKDLVVLLSTGAIFATFGSAVATLGAVWERDLLERVRLNIDILYKDILHQESPWRRWPFLARSGERRLLDGSIHAGTLRNPEVPLDVGTHVLKISLPTALEDFFDLPLLMNFAQLSRFRVSASTVFTRVQTTEVNPETGMNRSDAYMAYECLYDIWRSILSFRLARYATHLGAGLTIAGTAVTALHVATRAV
jgi:hypothetical protein